MPPPKPKNSRMLTLINYRLRVTLNDTRQIIGQMLAFDRHMNLVLVDSIEFRRLKGPSNQGDIPKEMKRALGLIVLRGETIISISVEGPPPVKDEEPISAGPGLGAPAGRGMPLGAGMGAAPPAFQARPMPYAGGPPPPGFPGPAPGFRPPPGFLGAPSMPGFPTPPPGKQDDIHNIVTDSVQGILTDDGIPASQLPDIISNLARDGHLSNFITKETLENVKHFASTDRLNATYVSLDGLLSLIDSLLVSSPKQDSLLDEEPLDEISFIQNMGDSPVTKDKAKDGVTPKISRTNKFKRPKPARKFVRSNSSYTDTSDYYSSDNDNDFALHSPTSSPPQTPNIDNKENLSGFDGLMLSNAPSNNALSNDALIHTQNQIKDLEKRNADLEKRLKEAERSYTQTTSQNEDYISIMEDQLKENDAKLEALVRDEKDLRAKDRQNMFTINKLEHDIATYQRQAESARIQASSLQSQLGDVNDEIDSLRDSLRDKDRDVREARSGADKYEHEMGKWENERKGYDDALQRIKTHLDVARKSERVLEVQKTENLGLKETIDRLRGDLSHQLAYNGSGSGGADETGGQLGSVSRNLGKELARQLTEDGEHDNQNPTNARTRHELGEGEIETIVTTRRRKVKPSVEVAVGVGSKEGGTAEHHGLEEAQADAEPAIESPPPYSQGQAGFEYVDDVRKVCSRGVQVSVNSRGVDTQTEVDSQAEINDGSKRADNEKETKGKTIWSKLYAIFKISSRKPNVIPIYSTIVFLCGMIGGAWILPSTTSSVESLRTVSGVDERAMFVAYNTFEGATWLLNTDNRLVHFIQSVVWSGVDTSQLFPA
ncbi:hypothetical protein E3P86_01717 [Wallemia ichthyophaga]|uniref:Sm protein B n=1 Tax=Wallemia ichthyophaga TaxID=245174 RepID=A0A4T0J6A3_WALIC|nr:hypothetical protein E3P86_01717 [Wallemia ichthyophaga]